MQIKGILKQLGLDEKTEKVYITLLKLADAPAAKIAKEAELKRTSIYHILENLASMGLVSSYIHRGVKRYAAENPSRLKALFEQKAILAERLIPILQNLINEPSGKVKIKFFDSIEGLRGISEEALEAKEKKILTIGSSGTLLKFLGGKRGFGERRRKRNIFMRSLRFPGDEPGTNPRLNQVKFLGKNFEFPGYIMTFDDKVGVIIFEGRGFGFSVTSSAFSKIMKSVFEALWQTASSQPL